MKKQAALAALFFALASLRCASEPGQEPEPPDSAADGDGGQGPVVDAALPDSILPPYDIPDAPSVDQESDALAPEEDPEQPPQSIGDGWTAPRVQIPAQIYWGTYQHMEQLVVPGAKWDFVRKHMDGILLHQAYWLFNAEKQEAPATVAPKLARLLDGKPAIIEITRPHSYGKPYDKDWGTNDGKRYVDLIRRLVDQSAAGQSQKFHIEEIHVDLYMNLYKAIQWKYPYWSKDEVLAQATGYRRPGHKGRDFAGYWTDLNAQFFQAFPGVRIHACYPPVYFDWNNYPALVRNNLFENPLKMGAGYLKSSEFTSLNNAGVPFDSNAVIKENGHIITYVPEADQVVLHLDGKPVVFQIKGDELMKALFNALASNGHQMTGFVSDSPYPYMVWSGEDSAQAKTYRAKIRAYETWLQSTKGRHTLIVTSQVPGMAKDAWDKRYYEDAFKDIKLYQKEGGRANRYLFESWQDGPYRIVPEDTPYTFTNLVRDAIRYIKGTEQRLDLTIAQENGEPIGSGEYQTKPVLSQTLVLAPTQKVQRFTITLKNNGTVEAMPWLVAKKTRLDGFSVAYYHRNLDITSQIASENGYVLTNLLAKGASQAISVVVTKTSASTTNTGKVFLTALWNPQDPTNCVRDVVTIAQQK